MSSVLAGVVLQRPRPNNVAHGKKKML